MHIDRTASGTEATAAFCASVPENSDPANQNMPISIIHSRNKIILSRNRKYCRNFSIQKVSYVSYQFNSTTL
jgi:hypothetical protein